VDRSLIIIMTLYYFYIVAYMFYMFNKRKQAVLRNEIRTSHFRAYTGETPDYLKVIQNHFNNQFQIPILFLIVCLLTIQQQKTSRLVIGLAIVFVISRIVHSLIHLGGNNVIKRASAYFTGVVIVGIMFLINAI